MEGWMAGILSHPCFSGRINSSLFLMEISALFEPKSVAIIGASTRPGTVGNDIVKNLVEQGYAGDIYPVNPKATELYGRVCYANISQVPAETIDMVVMVIPAVGVAAALDEAARAKSVRAAIVIASGFKESGHADLERELRRVAEIHDIALVGPNCLGVINAATHMNASFASTMPVVGPVAFLSQSGALCTAVLDYAQDLGIGFSRFASIGNKAVLDEAKFLEYLEQDAATQVIAMYVEDFHEPRALLEIARRMIDGQHTKPIIVLKSGRTEAGSSALASHTGSLAGSDASYDALFDQAGIIRVDTIDELFGAMQIFAHNVLPTGRQVAIITNAGGPGVIATDALGAHGLTLATLSPETQETLRAALPSAANTHDPIDVLGDALADRYRVALGATTADPGVDSLLVILTPQSMTEIEATAEAIAETHRLSSKPIAVSFMGSDLVHDGVRYLLEQGVAAYRFPEAGVEALAYLTEFSERSRRDISVPFAFNDIDRRIARELIDTARRSGSRLPEAQAVPVFAAYGFRTLKSFVVRSAEEAQGLSNEFLAPLVIKIVSPEILHKSDVGGVRVGIRPENLGSVYTELLEEVAKRSPEAHLEGALLVEMAPSIVNGQGMELVLGSIKDPVFGHLAMVGLGGILVEVFKDVSFGLVPFDRQVAETMIDRLKSRAILDGVRGGARLDVPALVDALGRLSLLLSDFPEIKELDINPLLVLPEGRGTMLLDARIILE